MKHGQLNTALNRPQNLGLWPFDSISDWWNSTPASSGSGALSTAAQQQALAAQNAQIVAMLNEYRDHPTAAPWGLWQYAAAAATVAVVGGVGYRVVKRKMGRR